MDGDASIVLDVLYVDEPEKPLNVVKIRPKKTAKELIEDVLKKFSESELNDIPLSLMICFTSEENITYHDNEHPGKSRVPFIGMIECIKSMELEAWHSSNRDVTTGN